MRPIRLRALGWAPLLIILASASASAQHINFEAEHERGLRLREENHNEEALAVFQHIFDLRHEPRALARMALAEGALNRWTDAEAHLIAAIAARRDRWIRHNRAGLRQNLAVIRSHIGSVQVSSNVSGAELFVAGVRLGTLPLPQPLRLSTGPTELEVRAEGYVTTRQPVEVVANGNLSVVVALAAEPPPPPPAPEPPPAPPPPPPLVCPGAQVSTAEMLGHCCWPGQVFSTVAQSCTGSPQCPSGMIARGETCAEAPPPPPPVIVQRVDPEASAGSGNTSQFMLAVSGGVNLNESPDVPSFTSQARIGAVLGGHFLLGFVGWYLPAGRMGGGALEMGGEFGGDVVRAQVSVQTGLYSASAAAGTGVSSPLVLNFIPEIALLVFPTRSFYLGIQLQVRLDVVAVNATDAPPMRPLPIGLFEIGIRL